MNKSTNKSKGVNVSLELSNRPAGEDTVIFMPTNHLLGIVQRIVASRDNTRIVLPGNGEVAIFPGRREYYANVQDIAEFCSTSSAKFEVTVFGEAELAYATNPRMNIRDLLWQAAFHVPKECLVEGCSKYDVVKFRHWPNLTRLPVTPNAARICALLTRHPTTIMLVHRMLGIDKTEVYQIYNAAHCAGIAETLSQAHFETVTTDNQPEPVKEHGLFRSLFAKISGL